MSRYSEVKFVWTKSNTLTGIFSNFWLITDSNENVNENTVLEFFFYSNKCVNLKNF